MFFPLRMLIVLIQMIQNKLSLKSALLKMANGNPWPRINVILHHLSLQNPTMLRSSMTGAKQGMNRDIVIFLNV